MPCARRHVANVASSSERRSAVGDRGDRDRRGDGGGGDDGEKSLHGHRVHRAALTRRGTKDEHPWKTRPLRALGRETDGVSTVLLVEDDPEIVALLADFLAVEDFGVVSAPDWAARSTRSARTRSPAWCWT